MLFSSNRSGNLDLWMLETATGAVRQITDDVAEDWDPDFSADGSKILWSSSRSGNLEIWMANADGSNAVQVSNDGVDAENPTATPALEWIVHSSSNPSGSGIWKVRPDGSDATRIAEGVFAIPEVSPDGRYAAYLAFDQTLSVIRVVELETATILPFEIRSPIGGANLIITIGRVRWLPDGSGIAFIGVDDAARTGIYVQDFDPERNTDHTRRVLAGFSDDYGTESFDISGDRIIVSRANETRSLMLATGVPGVDLERSQSASP